MKEEINKLHGTNNHLYGSTTQWQDNTNKSLLIKKIQIKITQTITMVEPFRVRGCQVDIRPNKTMSKEEKD